MSSSMRNLYRKSLRQEALTKELGQDNIAPAERVKQRMAEAKSQQTKALLDTVDKFISNAETEPVPEMIERARHVASLIPPVAEMYDAPDEVDVRIRLSDLYVWLSSLESAPSQKMSDALETLGQIYDDLVVEFSSGTD